MRDLGAQIALAVSIAPKAVTASTNGTGVDLANVDGAVVCFFTGAYTDGTHTPKIQESDDNSTFTDVAAADQIGSFTAVSSTAGQNGSQKVTYIGTKRYIRGVITVASATTGMLAGVEVVRGFARKLPAA